MYVRIYQDLPGRIGYCHEIPTSIIWGRRRVIALAPVDCLSAEYFASEPRACQLSSSCDAKIATDAKKDWLVTLYVKVAKYDYD